MTRQAVSGGPIPARPRRRRPRTGRWRAGPPRHRPRREAPAPPLLRHRPRRPRTVRAPAGRRGRAVARATRVEPGEVVVRIAEREQRPEAVAGQLDLQVEDADQECRDRRRQRRNDDEAGQSAQKQCPHDLCGNHATTYRQPGLRGRPTPGRAACSRSPTCGAPTGPSSPNCGILPALAVVKARLPGARRDRPRESCYSRRVAKVAAHP